MAVKYVIVSPVKDEAKYVEHTLRSVTTQTVLPTLWVIVDDGSSDRTPEILSSYAKAFPWIQVLRIDRGADRNLGVAEIRAFTAGYKMIHTSHDFVVKLDCDVELPSSYFEELFKHFEKDPRLGIASGLYVEKIGNSWVAQEQPDYHAVGASKVIRRKCFEDIGGFVLYRGWDTVDEIKAMMLGWTTAHFSNLVFRHLKREGSSAGAVRTNMFHGEIYYLTGGGLSFLVLKAIHRSYAGKPRLLSGLLLIWGYLRAALSRQQRVVTEREAKFYRRMLSCRVREEIKLRLGVGRQISSSLSEA